VRGRPAGREWDRYRDVVGAGLRAADAVVAPTRAYLDDLARLYGPLPAAAAIPNGLAGRGLRPLAKERLVLGAGRFWDEAKNLAALERLGRRLDAPVLIAGDGAPLGRVSPVRLAELYGRAAIFASPARYEPFGLAAAEAALCGCALVLGDLPTLREVWGDDAVFVAPADEDALAAACTRLLSDDAERERLARAARRRALSYSRERMTAAYLDLYRRLLATPRTPARAQEALR
jgi:glycosyltransferase involved in cell wall biosynthesis